jgi:hypothetical protein
MTDFTGAAWRKASQSSNGHASCVEVTGSVPGVIGVRDSKDPGGPALEFGPAEWAEFTNSIKAGVFDGI